MDNLKISILQIVPPMPSVMQLKTSADSAEQRETKNVAGEGSYPEWRPLPLADAPDRGGVHRRQRSGLFRPRAERGAHPQYRALHERGLQHHRRMRGAELHLPE